MYTYIECVRRNFLKYLFIEGVNPSQGLLHELSVKRLHEKTLIYLRTSARILFLYNITNNLIECPVLLIFINFRKHPVIICHLYSMNERITSNIHQFYSDFNNVLNDTDVFYTSRIHTVFFNFRHKLTDM